MITGNERAMDEATGRVFDIQGFTVNDGPGIRTELFLKGCPLQCRWCHSPESQAPYPQVAWYEVRCIGTADCGRCLEACPQKALKTGKTIQSGPDNAEITLVALDRTRCDNCGRCAEACPANALEMCGTDMTVAGAMARIEKDRLFYEQSGGGITLSGGEPVLQHRFTAALLRECKEKGLHTCLDTTGYAKWEFYEAILAATDLFLYDIKHLDSTRHRELTGVPNELILENARRLAAAGAALQLRVPVIPGCNDDEANLKAAAAFCRELGEAVTLVQLLPYHRLGTAKYERLQQRYALADLQAPAEAYMESVKQLFESYGLPVQIH